MKLTDIKYLWRQPDTMALYGIPHELRPGQSPRDIVAAQWPCRHEHATAGVDLTRCPPRKRSGEVPGDWMWLGSPGWWGTMGANERAVVETFLGSCADVPAGPGEWCAAKRKADPVPTRKMVRQAARLVRDDSMGLCISCGAEACQVEPDARKYKCQACGDASVYGAEEIIMQWGGL